MQAREANPPDRHESVLFRPMNRLEASDELRSLQFFQEISVRQLSGYFTGHFWSDGLIRLALHEPIVGNAILALSSFHECFLRGSISGSPTSQNQEQYNFALSRYNLAIKDVLYPAPDQASSLDIHLITCLIFISIEVGEETVLICSTRQLMSSQALQGHQMTAVRLFARGLQVLTKFLENENNSPCLLSLSSDPERTTTWLQQAFMRLELQINEACIFVSYGTWA